MSLSMYDASVPVFVRMLNNLASILIKGAAHAEARKVDPAVLLGSRLFPDMFSLTRQVQIATDSAKAGASRIAGLEAPAFADTETTFEQLIERVRNTVAYLESLTPDQFVGAHTRMVTWQTRSSTNSMVGQAYLLNHATPNLYFHITTAYDILRHNGVELGKRDFLGKA